MQQAMWCLHAVLQADRKVRAEAEWDRLRSGKGLYQWRVQMQGNALHVWQVLLPGWRRLRAHPLSL
jgi:hypothetical protein